MLNWFVWLHCKKIAKLVQAELDKIKLDLKQFKLISFNYLNYINTLRKFPNFKKLITEYEDLSLMIEQHNSQIQKLTKQFKQLINKNKNEFLTYSQQEINDLDAIVQQINKYQNDSSNSLSYKYHTITQTIQEIKTNFDYLQQCLEYKKRYEALINVLPDQYIDQASAKEYIDSFATIAANFNAIGKKYYQLDDPIEIIKEHNENFIERHLNDPVLQKVCGKKLDLEQCQAILCDAQSNLVIAGAGTGKTLTICGKVKYLIETGKAKPEEILLLTYSKNSAKDLQERIKQIPENIEVKTFHSIGLSILNKTKDYANTPEKNEKLKTIINQYLMDLLKDKRKISQLFKYFAFYLQNNHVDKYEKSLKAIKWSKNINDLSKIKMNEKEFATLNGESVRSFQEMIIANYLYLNDINFEYEEKYYFWTANHKRRQYYPDFYLPSYNIYLEHFGVDENGQAHQYGKKGNLAYQKAMAWKRKIHQRYKTKLIETFSWEFEQDCLLEKLEKQLNKNGISTNTFSQAMKDTTIKLIKRTWEFYPLTNLLVTFINHYNELYRNKKSDGFAEIENALNMPKCDLVKNKNRARFFLSICREIYDLYIKDLEANKKIDFADMILTAKDELIKYPERVKKHKYIIVDEFQDISQSRLKLLNELINHGQAKLFAVGDNWQAIYRFAGCDINIILEFEKRFNDVQINKITKTRRNSQELQNIVGEFIKQNNDKFDKSIESDFHETNPIQIVFYKTSKLYAFINTLYAIRRDADMHKWDKVKILVLGRYNDDIKWIMENNHFKSKANGQYEANNLINLSGIEITFKTIHSSKGLESDYVILLNGDKGYKGKHNHFGFPSEKQDDELLNLILTNSSKDQLAEERRLFYVALTRTKSKVYILSKANHSSSFIDEIKDKCECNTL